MTQPIACDLNAIPADQRARHEALVQGIFASVTERRELPDGYSFRLPPDQWFNVAEWTQLERLCCPFFNFRLEFREGGEFWLSLTGTDDVKALLAVEFNLN